VREQSHLLLELEDVVKHYRGSGEEIHAVDRLTLGVQAGEMVAIHGPSGSGKTTLLLMIAALLAPDNGSIRFDGCDLASFSDRQVATTSCETSGSLLSGSGSCQRSLRSRRSPQAAARRRADARAQERARPWLEQVGLGDRLGHKGS
jgi:putative ABC transport system ATP-binding protein